MEQLKEAASSAVSNITEKIQNLTTDRTTLMKQTGCPVAHVAHSLTAGPTGPVLLQDHVLTERIKQFVREKIPARNVHALGTGAYGTFTVTNDISQYTKASLFSKVGAKIPLFARMSGIFTEQGDPDVTRDPRGFAMKFYTDEGNWDLLAINTPVFNVRDAKPGVDGVHAFKRDPRTGMWNPEQTWDFIVNHPESLHHVLMLYTDRVGTPISFRQMHGYGCHTFAFTNKENKRVWVKFHLIADLGAKGFTAPQAKLIAGEDPNFLGRDLHQAIEQGNYPTWKFCCQIMPEEEGYLHPWAFDATKVWKHKDYPLIEIGKIELNRNPVDYFSEVEQVAFSPTTIVPGIGFSPDKLLQGRLLIYDDAQHHRIGPNYKQLPINRPKFDPNTNYVGGNMHLEIKNKFPHYTGSVFGGLQENNRFLEPPLRCDGPADFYPLPGEGSDEDIYGQVRDFWNILSETDRNNLCFNICLSLSKVNNEQIRRMALNHFYNVNRTLGDTINNTLTAEKIGTMKKTEGELVLDQANKFLGIGVGGERPVSH